MRLAIDGTPFLGPRSGIGEVVGGITGELARRDDLAITAYALTLRGRHDLAAQLPPGVRAATRAYPARLVRQAWLRCDHPHIERWTGPVDVVHATNYVAPPTHAAVVVSVYDLGFVHSPEQVTRDALQYPQLLRRAIARGAWIHTTSDFVREEVVTMFAVPEDRVVRVYPGVPPTEGGDSARGRAVAGVARYILAIGTIEPRKNYPRLIEAFDELADRDPDVVLVIVGTRGWGADEFDVAFDRARHRDRIRVTGYVSSADRRDLLAGAQVLAYPSHYEGFGFPPLEAMAAGTPVVATRAGAIPEIVGDAALLVEPDDVAQLTASLDRVLHDDDLRRRLVALGHTRRTAFSWSTAADQLLELYGQACA